MTIVCSSEPTTGSISLLPASTTVVSLNRRHLDPRVTSLSAVVLVTATTRLAPVTDVARGQWFERWRSTSRQPELEVPEGSYGISGLVAKGQRAVVAAGWQGKMSVIDASDASAPAVTGSIQLLSLRVRSGFGR